MRLGKHALTAIRKHDILSHIVYPREPKFPGACAQSLGQAQKRGIDDMENQIPCREDTVARQLMKMDTGQS